MINEKTKYFWLILLIFVFLNGCVFFVEPLSIPQKDIGKDERLIGKWKGEFVSKGKDKELVFLDFQGKSKKEIELSVFYEDFRVDSRNFLFKVFTAKINENHYLILKSDEISKQGYLIVKYEINDGQLAVWMLDLEKIEKIINEGKLKGEVATDGFIGIKMIAVNGSSQEITELIKSSDKNNFFTHLGYFQKLPN